MKKWLMLTALIIPSLAARTQDFSNYPVYTERDLGVTYTTQKSVIRVWSPAAKEMQFRLYEEGVGGEPLKTLAMKSIAKGAWELELPGDQHGRFYTVRAKVDGKWSDEVPDPYAWAVGVNGRRGMIVDLKRTDPAGWEADRSPLLKSPTDAIIYELHIRDATIHQSSGVQNRGKYVGLAEIGSRNDAGLPTGVDHIKELGVTHVHLLPFYDFLSVDESKMNVPQYNWGYEPLNYNTPEGSYATNAIDGVTRIRELKQMIQAFHQKGLGVVMDVVYNHTMLTEDSWFNELVPGYYYRQDDKGNFSNATACGNETASERPMMRKFMIESLEYWVKEYHIDGFRFDLMGVHDIATMNLIAKRLRKIKPDILLYGEGWTAGASPLPEELRAVKKNAAKLDGIAVFSDDIRDGLKGSVFVNNEAGFVSGRPGMEQSIRFGVTAACPHGGVDYSKVNYSKAPYAKNPSSVVSYAECHDNHVLWDKLALSAPQATAAERIEMHKLALAIVLTSQGISFLHAGTEFLRSKGGNENSYNAGDEVNAIDWNLKTKNKDVVDYVQALIDLRKQHPMFRMATGKNINEKTIRFLDTPPGVIAYIIDGKNAGDSWDGAIVVYNATKDQYVMDTPAGKFSKHLLPGQKDSEPDFSCAPLSCTIIARHR